MQVRGGNRRKAGRRLVLFAATVSTFMTASLGQAHETVRGQLSAPRHEISAVFDGTYMYLFGGHEGSRGTDLIQRYDPVSGLVDTLDERLTIARGYTSAVWDGTYAYIFGGYDPATGSFIDVIERFDPATQTIKEMSARLSSPRRGTASALHGQSAYIMGGRDAGGPVDLIERYDIVNDQTSIVGSLPQAAAHIAAATNGQEIYLFGGSRAVTSPDNIASIFRFDPTTYAVTTMAATLPTGRHGASALWDGGSFWVVGGWGGVEAPPDDPENHTLFDLVRYDPATDIAQLVGQPLAQARDRAASVWANGKIVLAGGETETERPRTFPDLADIVELDPSQSHAIRPSAQILRPARDCTYVGDVELSCALSGTIVGKVTFALAANTPAGFGTARLYANGVEICVFASPPLTCTAQPPSSSGSVAVETIITDAAGHTYDGPSRTFTWITTPG